MEVSTIPFAFTQQGTIPTSSGGPMQRINSLARERAAPVCFGQGLTSHTSRVPWDRCHPLKREPQTVSPPILK